MLKALCLHGFRTNARILQFQLSAFRRLCGEFIEFDYIDAPHVAVGPPEDAVLRFFPNDTYYEWYNSQKIQNANGEEITEYVGMEETLLYIQNHINNNGPYDILLGFSQGGIMATMLNVLTEYQEYNNIFNQPFEPNGNLWRLTIIANSMRPRATNFLPLNQLIIHNPSIHLIGTADFMYEASKSLAEFYDPNYRTIYEHSGGHKFPDVQTGIYEQTINNIKTIFNISQM